MAGWVNVNLVYQNPPGTHSLGETCVGDRVIEGKELGPGGDIGGLPSLHLAET